MNEIKMTDEASDIRAIREALEAWQETFGELHASYIAERARADQAEMQAVRKFLAVIPERIVTVNGRGGLNEFVANYKPSTDK